MPHSLFFAEEQPLRLQLRWWKQTGLRAQAQPLLQAPFSPPASFQKQLW